MIESTSTKARVLRLGDNVGLTPLAARTSSGVLLDIDGRYKTTSGEANKW